MTYTSTSLQAHQVTHTRFTSTRERVVSAITGSLQTARGGHTATLLPNGLVLVAGGVSGNGATVLKSAELYNPTSGTWTPTQDMNSPRSGHTATLLPDGKVLVAGGSRDSGPFWVSSAEIYDPIAGTWTPTGSMSLPRSGHTATLLSDGRVLVAGGITSGSSRDNSTDSADIYNPASGIWTPASSMNASRVGHTATLLSNGSVLIVGGRSGEDPLFTTLRSAEVFSPTVNLWTPVGDLQTGRESHTAVRLQTGKVLVVGGYDSNYSAATTTELYDPITQNWWPANTLQHGDLIGILRQNGTVLVLGDTTAKLYDPDSNSWNSAGTVAISRFGSKLPRPTLTLLQNNLVLLAGGYNNGQMLNSAELLTFIEQQQIYLPIIVH